MDDDYYEAELDLAQAIPPGRVMTYGSIAEVGGDQLAADGGPRRGGPRQGGPGQAGQVLARAGGAVPWWRVVNAAGSPPASNLSRALTALQRENTPLVAAGLRVDLTAAMWWPDTEETGPS
ncbi:MAG: MGMT family protein [Cellulomonas sp.]|nr:MGMT family protein [Cellulomonas sp.]